MKRLLALLFVAAFTIAAISYIPGADQGTVEAAQKKPNPDPPQPPPHYPRPYDPPIPNCPFPPVILPGYPGGPGEPAATYWHPTDCQDCYNWYNNLTYGDPIPPVCQPCLCNRPCQCIGHPNDPENTRLLNEMKAAGTLPPRSKKNCCAGKVKAMPDKNPTPDKPPPALPHPYEPPLPPTPFPPVILPGYPGGPGEPAAAYWHAGTDCWPCNVWYAAAYP